MADPVYVSVDVSHRSSEPVATPPTSSHHPRTLAVSRNTNEPSAWPRNHRPSFPRHNALFLLFILLTCCVSFSSAAHYFIDEQMVEAREVEPLESTFARLARSGTILVDRSPPPVPAGQDAVPEAMDDDLKRRRAESSSSSSQATTLKTSVTSMVPSSTSSSASIAAATQAVSTDLPSPFDLGFSGNITSNCQSFMTSMLANATFKACLPFSLLLQNSNSFFQVEKSLVRITQTLDFSCSANVTTCSRLMSSLASNITTDSACSTDLASQNPVIQQAHLGLLAYRPLYSASCLRNPSTAAYCFADAITSNSSADAYVYYLPLNNTLVGGSQPNCNTCLRSTMNVFEAATSDRSSALASVYASAASQVNVNCGPSFVNASLAAAVVTSGSAPLAGPSHVGLLTLVLLLASWLL